MNNLPFRKKNYVLLIIGIVLIAVGLVIMTLDKAPYGFGFMGITLGPIIIMLGFVVEFYAIFAKDSSKQ